MEPRRRTVIRGAARRYIAGTSALEAVEAAGSRPFTIGYWEAADDTPELIARQYEGVVEAVAAHDAYVSVRPDAWRYDAALLARLGVPVHLDIRRHDTADATWSLADRIPVLGVTLPGRWPRSVSDAARAAELGVQVRVVKGQFPSPDDVDLRSGFLAVVGRLVELGVARIMLATHDAPLIAEARQLAPHASVEHMHGAKGVAPDHRVYVPFASAYLPYSVRYVRERSNDLLRRARLR